MSNMLDTAGAHVTMGSVEMTSSHDPALGAALRQARNARGLSLAQVADATSISRSLLSLIETGRSDITIGRLGRLAQLYDLRLADLVPEPRHPDPVVVRADDRPLMHYDSEEIDVEVLVPEGPHALQALLATYAPNAHMEDFVVQQNEQFVYLLEGRSPHRVRGRARDRARARRQRDVHLRRGRPPPRQFRRLRLTDGDRDPPHARSLI